MNLIGYIHDYYSFHSSTWITTFTKQQQHLNFRIQNIFCFVPSTTKTESASWKKPYFLSASTSSLLLLNHLDLNFFIFHFFCISSQRNYYHKNVTTWWGWYFILRAPFTFATTWLNLSIHPIHPMTFRLFSLFVFFCFPGGNRQRHIQFPQQQQHHAQKKRNQK